MEYRRLGKSGLQVSAFSLGSWMTFGFQISDDMAEKLMKLAYDNGVNFFDNAETYANGKSELAMGKILKKMKWKRDSWLVSSKVYYGEGGELPNQKGLSKKRIFEACDAALKRLQVDYLDMYFCHRPDKHCPTLEIAWAMQQLIMQGKVLYWGSSEWTAEQIREAHGVCATNNLIPPTMEQPMYNMFNRRKVEQEFNRLYNTVGLGTTVFSPLASGFLSGKYNQKKDVKASRLNLKKYEWLKRNSGSEDEVKLKKVDELIKVAKDLNISMPQLALAWCLKNPNVSTVLLGATKEEQLKENLKSLSAVPLLKDDVMQRIEGILQNKPPLPEY
jgi:voltage-dependent potassium channel beta subunit